VRETVLVTTTEFSSIHPSINPCTTGAEVLTSGELKTVEKWITMMMGSGMVRERKRMKGLLLAVFELPIPFLSLHACHVFTAVLPSQNCKTNNHEKLNSTIINEIKRGPILQHGYLQSLVQ
jgi:hypothetical protein